MNKNQLRFKSSLIVDNQSGNILVKDKPERKSFCGTKSYLYFAPFFRGISPLEMVSVTHS